MATIAAQSAGSDTTNNANVSSQTFVPGADDLLIAIAIVTGNATGGMFTGGGPDEGSGYTDLGWTEITTAKRSTNADTLVVAVADTPAEAQITEVLFHPSGGTSSGARVVVISASSMSRHGISAIRQYAKQENQSNAIPAPAFSSSALTGNPTIGIVASAEQVTHPTSWTEIAEGGYLTPDTFSEVASRNSGFTGTTITWGGTVTSAWCSLIIELDASVAVVVSGPFRSVASQYHVPGSVANQGR